MSFVKLDDTVLDSSVWTDGTRALVWVTCLLMARPITTGEPCKVLKIGAIEDDGWEVPPGRYGVIEAAASGIIARARVAEKDGLRALAELAAQDPESRNPEFNGRRIARVPGGFIVLNFDRYRDRDYTGASRQKRFRENLQKQQDMLRGNGVTPLPVTEKPIEDRRQRTKEKEKKARSFDPVELQLPPKLTREVWAEWAAYRKSIRKPLTENGAVAQLKFLSAQTDPDEVIRTSIRNEWRGLFPLKGNGAVRQPDRVGALGRNEVD